MLRGLLPSFGVTGLYVGTFASGIENLERCFRYLREYLKESEKEISAGPGRGTRLHGGLLEGTFLNPAMSGAQNPELVFEPSIKTFDRIKGQGIIRLANVVPDSGKTSCELIRSLTERGVIVGAGHTDATADQVYDAVEAGLKYIIHFTNGPTGGSYKPFGGGGAVEGILSSDDLMVELICDGYHVNPAYVLDIIARKGVDRVVGITDAIHVSGSDLKEIELEGVTGRVSDDGRYFYVLEKKNTLFSSNLTMNKAFENLLNWQTADSPGIWNRRHAALPLEEAMVRTARMCSTNACRLTGLGEKGFGSIQEGYVADLCIMEIRGKPGSFEVQVHAAIIQGETAYTREEKP
jgi:N-acetylglucosamine-6-phosphate deacetylase